MFLQAEHGTSRYRNTEIQESCKAFLRKHCFYHLKIGVAGASFFALIEKTGTDLTGISSAAIIFTYMNGIDADVVAIQDSKTCGNDLAVFVMEAQTVSLRMARYMEGTTLR